jgi:hypothetical protein
LQKLVDIDHVTNLDSFYGAEASMIFTNIERQSSQVPRFSQPSENRDSMDTRSSLNLNLPLNEHFKFLATIGKGAYGSVYLVENKLCPEQAFAIKSVRESR